VLKVTEQWIEKAEKSYPGIRETIAHYEARTLPHCPRCGSADSATVSAGLVGRSITVAAATTKIRLLSNGPRPGEFFCNACSTYFDPPAD
jgi:hypothetical protein